MNTVAITVVALGLFVLIRNEMTHRWVQRNTDLIHERNVKRIEEGSYSPADLDLYGRVHYELVMFDLSVWSFKKFQRKYVPELA